MTESKIELTERLRREGRWAEASARKDAIVKELRGQGMCRREANEEGWRRMAAEFHAALPAEQPPEQTADIDLEDWCLDAADCEVGKCLAEHNITLATDAVESLVVAMAHCWMMGLMGYAPGPEYRSRGSARGSGGCFSVRFVWRSLLRRTAEESDAQPPATGGE